LYWLKLSLQGRIEPATSQASPLPSLSVSGQQAGEGEGWWPLTLAAQKACRRAPRGGTFLASRLGTLLAGGQAHGLSDLFTASVRRTRGEPSRIHLERQARAWDLRLGRAGTLVFAAHPCLDLPAADLVSLYRSKDKVEKDFQTIKSVLELRPVYHRTDQKVRAHVIVCILALALERLMEERLRHAGLELTAPAALEKLANIDLCEVSLPGAVAPSWRVSRAEPEAMAIAQALGVSWALADGEVSPRLRRVKR
jgi:hypothetical protein